MQKQVVLFKPLFGHLHERIMNYKLAQSPLPMFC